LLLPDKICRSRREKAMSDMLKEGIQARYATPAQSHVARRDDRMPPTLSIYLDLVRFGACAVVVSHHAWPILFSAYPIPWPGHDAVVVFFVLSGLVIAHATSRPNLTMSDYALQRAARILSVVVPALALSAVASVCVGGVGLGEPGPPSSGWLDGMLRIAANLFCVAQIWGFDVGPPLNAPFWSINFEIWYYALFGAWMFLTGLRRAITLATITLIVGPKILLMLPIWLLGAGLYYHRPHLSDRAAVVAMLMTSALALGFIQFDVSVLIRTKMIAVWPTVMAELHSANQFVGDWLLALIVGANFAAAASMGRFGASLVTWARPIRAAAGCTFSAYLYHIPLLALAYLSLGLRSWVAFLAVAAGIVVLAQVTEGQLPAVRRLLHWLRLRQFPNYKRPQPRAPG
jgi:peptidoglycan/LPS O-acetylase OafA/YrhL